MAGMGAIADLWKSERGLVAIVLIAACSVLLGLGRLTVDAWTTYTMWIYGTYVAGKTVTGAVALATTKPDDTDEIKSFKLRALDMLEAYMKRDAGPGPTVAPAESPPTSTSAPTPHAA